MLDYRTHTFLEVYRQRSFTRAAQALSITQPAVSQHVRQLEAHYGCALFAKAGRAIEPTPAADVLYRALGAMAGDERRLRDEVRRLAAPGPGRMRLRFGCTRTVADFTAPAIVSGHLARHPGDHLLMRSGNTHELVGLIERGEIDFALVEGSFDRRAFDSAVFSREAFVAVGPTGRARPSSLEGLLGERLVLREPGSGTREILETHLATCGLAVSDFADTLELGSVSAVKACVGAGAGVTFLYRVAVEAELASGALADVTPPDFAVEHDFALIWQRGSLYAERHRALCAEWREALGT